MADLGTGGVVLLGAEPGGEAKEDVEMEAEESALVISSACFLIL